MTKLKTALAVGGFALLVAYGVWLSPSVFLASAGSSMVVSAVVVLVAMARHR